ncbi:MAG: FAD-binding protein [Candidatus Nezhaarchaeota archaeon]|nr:FAD-binding protein [Candidatus Nezhaarchaeota archaeon]
MIEVKRISTDVLVIGGGAAGMRAAIAASDMGAQVVLIDKGLFGRSGMSGTLPYWNVPAPPFPEDRDGYFEDLMNGSHGLADPKLIKILVSEGKDRVLELEEYGNIFIRDSAGEVSPAHADSHSKARIFTPAYSWIMSMQVLKRGIVVYDETFATRLIKSNDRVSGAVAFNLKEGSILAVEAKATVLATGGAGHLFGMDTRLWQSTNPIELTGDGYALAYDVGAELIDMEFNQIALEPQYSASRGQTYSSTALALARTLRSATTFQETPSVHHFLGGVLIDENGRTTVPSLYACGEVSGGLHLKATDQFIGCLVFGRRAGEAAAIEKAGEGMPEKEVKKEVNRVISILNNAPNDGVPPHVLRKRLTRSLWEEVGLRKDENSLTNALRILEDTKILLPKMIVRDKSKLFNKEWVEALETYNMVIVAEMIVRSSLLRRESRGVFTRADYPRSDERYLGHFHIKKVGGQMHLEFRSLRGPQRGLEVVVDPSEKVK